MICQNSNVFMQQNTVFLVQRIDAMTLASVYVYRAMSLFERYSIGDRKLNWLQLGERYTYIELTL